MMAFQARSSEFYLIYIVFIFLTLSKQISSQDRLCSSTGPICYEDTNCPSTNGDYQWCGGCEAKLTCTGGVGQLYNFTNPLYPAWDDNKKSFQITSSTCVECYTECPPWYIVPKDGDGQCGKTGPTCVPGINFCQGFVQMKLIQYCGNCSAYVQCGGLFNPTVLQHCLGGSVWDDSAKSCVSASTTCQECFEHCDSNNFPTTVVSTESPTTDPPTTTTIATTIQTTAVRLETTDQARPTNRPDSTRSDPDVIWDITTHSHPSSRISASTIVLTVTSVYVALSVFIVNNFL